MNAESNMTVANEVLNDFIWWHKSIGLSGLTKESKLSAAILNAIRYADDDELSDSKLGALKHGIECIRDKTIVTLNTMIDKLSQK